MATALKLSYLALTFAFPLIFFFGLQEGISLGAIESSWVNYTTDNDRGFKFSFPSSWTVVNDTNKDNGIITLMPPNNYDLFAEKMTFGMEKLQPNMSLYEYSNNAVKTLSMAMEKFQLLDSNPFVFSNAIGEKILFTHETDNRIIKVLQFWSVKDDYVYIISFSTTPDSYFSYIPTIYKIISTIDIFTRNTTDNTANNIKDSIYQSPQGFVLKYPSNWNKVSGENRVSFISNQDNPQDHYLERVDFYHYRSGDNVSGNIIVGNDSLKLDLINEISYLADNLQNLDLISVNDMNVSMVLGKEILYTYDSNLGVTQSKEIMIKNNENLYVIIFTAQRDEFGKFSPSIDKIIDSFRLNTVKLY